MREFWQKWKSLLPAVLIAVGVVCSLAATQPQLEPVPELITPQPVAAEQTVAESTPQPEAEEEEEEEPEIEELACTDGIYYGTAQGYGGDIQVRVTVQSGEILAIDVVSADGETEKFFNRARRVVSTMLESNTWEVDTISGATLSSRGLVKAVQNALTGSGDKKTTVTKRGALSNADGLYTGTAEGFGGNINVCVTVQNGEIAAVDILEASGETFSFFTRAREIISTMVEGNTWEVDIVSGATYSSRGIKNAVKNALTGAGSEIQEQPEEPPTPTPETAAPSPTEAPAQSAAPTAAPDAVEDGQKAQSFWQRLLDMFIKEESSASSAASAPASEASSASSTPAATAAPSPTAGPTAAPASSEAAASAIMYSDGTYAGTAVCARSNRFDYDINVSFTVKNGVIGEITVAKGEDRSYEPSDNDGYISSAVGGSGVKAGIAAQITQNQSAESIDAISGATYTSRAIQAAVQNALAAGPQEASAS